MPKHPLSFILCLLFSITFIAISPVQMAHADDLQTHTLAGSMWTGNYNREEIKALLEATLAGSMWTGNYNGGVARGTPREL